MLALLVKSYHAGRSHEGVLFEINGRDMTQRKRGIL